MMELFWRENRPLSHGDLSELLKDTMSRNTVYLHLNNLLDKGFLQTGLSVRRGRTYGRTFTPTVSKTEYYARQVADAARDGDVLLEDVVSYFLGDEHITTATLDEIEKRIQEKRRKLES
ncbi:MAG TPA: BlaI/MecI/CopY family transcriptional regulator [Candidatus Evtepia faecavium]|nr:BlaI/MecI/CopY family transcriptional regulator [Candidatus Evtepia faecavium]